MNKAALLLLAITFTVTASASTLLENTLPERCQSLFHKVQGIQKVQKRVSLCYAKLNGFDFELAGEALAEDDKALAKTYLTLGISSLEYAESSGCKKKKLIKESIFDANSIKLAIKEGGTRALAP